MGKATAVLMLGFAVLMIVAAGTLHSLLILQRVAAVSDVQGDVKIQSARGGAFYPLGEARYVRAGDIIRTGEGGVTLNWVDGTRVRVGAHTAIKVLKSQLNAATDATVSTFRLDLGEVWVRVRKLLNPRSKFEVITPTCTAGVRGTLFAVSVQPSGETSVSVLEGKVELSRGGRAILIESMSQAKATPSGLEVHRLASRQHTDMVLFGSIDEPFLLVTEPPGNTAAIHEGAVLVKGIAERGTMITVNGQAVRPRRNGDFVVRLPAKEGEKINITVVARDDRGRSVTVNRQVTAIDPLSARKPPL